MSFAKSEYEAIQQARGFAKGYRWDQKTIALSKNKGSNRFSLPEHLYGCLSQCIE
ncbi:hypothetical protein J2Z18_002797 [Paenibacillus lactis]|uniref:Uncharacterized protein n=2 Tax=Paenibacillus lactis TaxID=228574 RepID=G4HA43_9BACL|nr:hypothetical protein PaelaDRAFT_1026 [Paenibacillus lactis 154]MBP1893694.1 hypothetical protein [Paenibacillus lactis]GIO92449.1 hypothetical protein J31TS3_36760 [Paenibacillus lactis]